MFAGSAAGQATGRSSASPPRPAATGSPSDDGEVYAVRRRRAPRLGDRGRRRRRDPPRRGARGPSRRRLRARRRRRGPAAHRGPGLRPRRSPAERVATWDRLAECESLGRWDLNTGNGYYGGLQFSLRSWTAVGGSGRPNDAAREEQIMRAELLSRTTGDFSPWPSCARQLGLPR